MQLKLRSKKGFLVLVTVLLSLIMVTATFSQVLGKPHGTGSDKVKTGYVETLGELLTYNIDGVQMDEVTDPTEIIKRVQYDEDFLLLIDEVAKKDNESTNNPIDPQILALKYSLVDANPLVVRATFDNGKLSRKMTGGLREVIAIEMVSLSLRSINDNDVHISVAYRADVAPGALEEEKTVVGVVTNNDASIDEAGLEHQVYYVHCIAIKHYHPIYWRIWWYDSHHHHNWFYGWYFWYWRYYWYHHNWWYPWYTWWWSWYYGHYWWYWSTWWPYIW